MWIIDVDHVAENDAEPGTNCNAVGIVGPREATGKENPTHPFRMGDDDGELYYEGRATKGGSFDPLDDFGGPNAGCTWIQWEVEGEWEYL